MSRKSSQLQIDHLPDPEAPVAPAPRLKRLAGLNFRPAVARKRTAVDPLITWDEVMRRSSAAVALTFRGESYGMADREDASATLVSRLYAKFPDASGVPRSRAAMSYLTSYAAGLRRDLDKRRRADLEEREDTEPTFSPYREDGTVDTEEAPTPAVARERVLTFLATTVRPERRKVRMAVALYSAAREAAHGEGADLAAELGMTPAAFRQTVKRGTADLLKYAPVTGYRRAVGAQVSETLTTEDLYLADGRAVRRSSGRTQALTLADGNGRAAWRHTGRETLKRSSGRGGKATRLYAPISTAMRETLTGKRRKTWSAALDGRQHTAHWRWSMAPGRATNRSRMRMARAAEMTRQRVGAETVSGRKVKRMAAGVTRDPR